MANVEALTTPLVEQALALAEKGLYVHPLVGKRPVLKAWQKRASVDPIDVKTMFDEVPQATNVGVVAGKSGLFIIDLDVNPISGEPDGMDWQNENAGYLPKTRVHRTPSGGYHLIYYMPKLRLPNISIAHKVDSRGDNGYVAWPTENSGYEVYRDRPVVELGEDFALELKQRASEIGKLTQHELETNIITDASGFALHDLINQLIYVMAKNVPDADLIIHTVRNIMDRSEALLTRKIDWQDRYDDIPRSVMGAVRRLADNARKLDETDEAYKVALSGVGIETPNDTWTTDNARPRRQEEPQIEVPDDIFTKIDFPALFAAPLPLTPWIMRGILERRSITGLAGWSNVGKTRWLISLTVAVSAGVKIPGWDIVEPGSVLIISREERVAKLARRLRATMEQYKLIDTEHDIVIAGAETSGLLTLLNQESDNGGAEISKSAVNAIMKQAKEINAVLIIFDPLVGMTTGLNENSSNMNELMNIIRKVADSSTAAIAFLHHTPKGSRADPPDWYIGSLEAFRGSGAIAAALDLGFTISRIGANYDGPRGDRPGIARSLGDAACRRWLRFAQAKGRETLIDTSEVFYLVDQQVAVEGADGATEGVGVLVRKTEQELVNASVRDTEDTIARANLRQMVSDIVAEHFTTKALIPCTATSIDRYLQMRDPDKQVWHREGMNAQSRNEIYALFPIIRENHFYDVTGEGRARKIVRTDVTD